MSRTTTFDLPVDSSFFTPLQLQQRTALWLAMTGWSHWLREHWVPFPRLIRDHKLGVVIASLDLEYLRPLGFFDADTLVGTAAVTVRSSGNLLFLALSIGAAGGDEAVRVRAVLRPVSIDEASALSATPTSLGDDVLSRFAPDEIVRTAPNRQFRRVSAELETGFRLVGVHSSSFTLHRHLCETADQWSGIALCDLASQVREELATSASIELSGLRAAFLQPMRRMTLEFWAAAFFLDEIVVECRAFESNLELVFQHRVTAAGDGRDLAGFLEWFPAVGSSSVFVAHDDQQQLVEQGGVR